MGIINWFREYSKRESNMMPAQSFLPLINERTEENGAIIFHSDAVKDIILDSIANNIDGPIHGGNLAFFFGDQLCSSSTIVYSALQSRQLLQIVGTPEALNGLRNGTMSILKSSGNITGTVTNTETKKFAAQLRFAPASATKVLAPIAVWQILNAVAGVSQLQKINTKLEALQKGIERLNFRMQAKSYGQLASAISTLESISRQLNITGTFSHDMVVRLSLAERDIRSCLAEQRLLVERFENIASSLKKNTKGVSGAQSCNDLLKEERTEFLIDANLLTAATRASVLCSEAWLRHDLEHNPGYVSSRLKMLEEEIEFTYATVSPLVQLYELQEHARACVHEMDWFNRTIFKRSLVQEIQEYERFNLDIQESNVYNMIPSALIWKDKNNNTRSVIVDVEFEIC